MSSDAACSVNEKNKEGRINIQIQDCMISSDKASMKSRDIADMHVLYFLRDARWSPP